VPQFVTVAGARDVAACAAPATGAAIAVLVAASPNIDADSSVMTAMDRPMADRVIIKRVIIKCLPSGVSCRRSRR
jgi:hypothetical protein